MSATRPYVPDTPEAKLWELLRRNHLIRRTVARMQALLQRLEKGTPTERRNASEAGHRILDSLSRKGNLFAELALQWLVPQPLFIIREAVVDDDQLSPSATKPRTSIDSIEWGTTPDPADPGWRRFRTKPGRRGNAQSQANFAGWPRRWGPEINTIRYTDPRILRKSRDEVAEWREWFSTHTFTLETPWKDAPPLFQRHWKGLWGQWTGSEQEAEETQFFQGWSLPDLIHRLQGTITAANACIRDLVTDLDNLKDGQPETVCPPSPTRGGNSMRTIPQFTLRLSETETAKLVRFKMFADRRVFALPRLNSKQEVERILKRLAAELSSTLPKTRELLGTQRAWTVFVEVEGIQCPLSSSVRMDVADFFRTKALPQALKAAGISTSDMALLVDNGRLKPLAPNAPKSMRRLSKRIERFVNQAATANRQRHRHFERWVALIERMKDATFPALNQQVLEEKSPS